VIDLDVEPQQLAIAALDHVWSRSLLGLPTEDQNARAGSHPEVFRPRLPLRERLSRSRLRYELDFISARLGDGSAALTVTE